MGNNDIQPGDKQFTASVFILTQEQPQRVLLIHHKKHNVWLYPGGHVDRNENPFEAMCREVKEETDIIIEQFFAPLEYLDKNVPVLPQPRWICQQPITNFHGQPNHFHIDSVYVVKIPYRDLSPLNNEGREWGWFTLEETKELVMFENTRVLLKRLFTEEL